MFLDYAKLFIKSGDGGSGIVSFRREKYVPRGGPDGGDGGRGGHIIFQATNDLSTLSEFRYQKHFRAGNGAPGEGGNRSGKDASDLIIKVPVGTVIKEAESKKVIADLAADGDTAIILKGGRGGRGNPHFATPTRQSPQFAEEGEPGRELWVELELKLLADVGLIGFPNAGKSSLLSRISAAKPKIADYPFTTIIPNLGVVDYKGQSFVAVDIPGLIEGAHQGVGLGDQFLRHIERTRLLVHLVDLSGISGRAPYADYQQINQELQMYNSTLTLKPQIIVANKMDLPEAKAAFSEFCQKIPEQKVIPISAATGEGINDLLDAVIQELNHIPKETGRFEIEFFEADLDKAQNDFKININKEGDLFVVHNDALLKRAARYNLSNEASVTSFQSLLKRWGVIKALEEAGIKEGDSVKIGDIEFTYLSEE